MTWALYAEGLEERLLDLHRRVQSGAYRALPVRRVEIPKPDGGTRPLGAQVASSPAMPGSCPASYEGVLRRTRDEHRLSSTAPAMGW